MGSGKVMPERFVVRLGHAVILQEFFVDVTHDLRVFLHFCIHPERTLVTVADDLAVGNDLDTALENMCTA